MQESRLFRIVYYLLDKGQATAGELAEKLEVSPRTIYRDIDALSEAGIPIYAETGRNGGIHLMEHFVFDRTLLSEEEKQEILTALQGLQATQLLPENDIFRKLSALFHLEAENWLEVDFARWGGKEYDNIKFKLLKSAIIHRKKVKLCYVSSYGEESERILEPLKLSYKGTAWYLKAFCSAKQDYRIFKLNRILELKVLEEAFSERSFPEPQEVDESNYREIILRFPKEQAYRVYDEFDRTQVEVQENGELIASAVMPEDGWLIGFLLSFGTQVEILEPASLKDAVAEQAKLIYEKYKP